MNLGKRTHGDLVQTLSLSWARSRRFESDLIEIRVELEDLRPQAEDLVRTMADVKQDAGARCARRC